MRIQRYILEYGCHVIVELVIQRYHLSDHICAAEILDCRRFGNHQSGRIIESRIVTVQVIEFEDLQQCRIGKADGLVKALRAHRDQELSRKRSGDSLDVRELGLDDRADR